jgi:hypothetical protein
VSKEIKSHFPCKATERFVEGSGGQKVEGIYSALGGQRAMVVHNTPECTIAEVTMTQVKELSPKTVPMPSEWLP